MANNKLRRDIQQHLDSVEGAMWTGTPLLRRAFEALGGPVADNRPVQETTAPAIGLSENILVGRDPGDETAHVPTDAEKTDLGRPVTDDGGFLVNGINPDPMYGEGLVEDTHQG